MRWDFFATGTWERPVTACTAFQTVETWLRKHPSAYAAVGIQTGPLGLRYHVHVLVGGIGCNGLSETLLRRSWVRGGHLLIESYHPTQGAVEYLVRQANEIELLGMPLHYSPRRRGRRGKRSGANRMKERHCLD
jgi:hypothetical protein